MGLERDRGWGAVQNCYPIAMEPLDGRNGDGGARACRDRLPVAGGGGRALGADGDGVAATAMAEALRVGIAL